MTGPYSHHVKRAKTEQSAPNLVETMWQYPESAPSPVFEFNKVDRKVESYLDKLAPGAILEHAPEGSPRAQTLDIVFGQPQPPDRFGRDYGRGASVVRAPSRAGDVVSYMRASPNTRGRFMESKERGWRSPLARGPEQDGGAGWVGKKSPLAYTSPRQEYERHYPREVLDRLLSSSRAAQEEWQQQNPDSLINPVIPRYEPEDLDRKIPILGVRMRHGGISPMSGYPRKTEDLPKPFSSESIENWIKGRGAAYLLNRGGQAFLDEAPELGRYAALPATPEGAELNAADRSKHPFHSAVGLHEAVHSLQNIAGVRLKDNNPLQSGLLNALVDADARKIVGSRQARYPLQGAGGLEMPAHLAWPR